MAGPGRLKLMDVPAESRRSIHSRGILVARLSARLLRILPALPLLAVLGACGCNPAVHVITGAGLGAGAGAAIGSFSGNTGMGAVIGGVAGGLLGAAASGNQVNAGPSPFDHLASRPSPATTDSATTSLADGHVPRGPSRRAMGDASCSGGITQTKEIMA